MPIPRTEEFIDWYLVSREYALFKYVHVYNTVSYMSVSHVHKRKYIYICVCVSMCFIHGYSSTCIEYITY